VSFRTRIGVLVAATAAVTVALASVIVYVLVSRALLNEVDQTLRDRIGPVGPVAIEVQPASGGPPVGGFASGQVLCTDGVGAPAGSAATPPADVGCQRLIGLTPPKFGAAGGYTQLTAPSGAVALTPGEPVQLPVSAADRALAASGTAGDVVFENADVAGTQLRVATTVLQGGQLLQVARPLDEMNAVLVRLRWTLAGLCLAVVLVAGFLGRLVARRTLQPVDRLMLAAEHVADTRDLRRRIEEPGEDELGRLAHSFNRMLEALEESQRTQRQLVADASHELRTPLSSLRTNIEVLARGGGLEAEDRDRLLADVLGQVERLGHLVADLMDLARGDEPTSRVRAEVPLDEVVAAAVDVAASHHPEVRFRLDARPSVVEGDPDRLARAVANLLDNAAKWSPPGAEVEVGVGGGEVTVRDHGPGIAPEHARQVFQRFWRAPDARSTPGSGLGLAIVQQVAETHGGEVRVEQPRGGGALLRLRIPAES
jgi:two-component system, OmpR family, sensor histidine kinase MprB